LAIDESKEMGRVVVFSHEFGILETWPSDKGVNDTMTENSKKTADQSHSKETLALLDRMYGDDHRIHACRAESPVEFTEWAELTRSVLKALIGLDSINESVGDFEASVELGESEDLGWALRTAGVLRPEPSVSVPFWYLRPKGAGPFPLALFPHGHYKGRGLDMAVGIGNSTDDEERIQAEERDVAVQATRRGFAAIAPATRGFPPTHIPDLNGRHDRRDCRSHFMHAVLAGRTAIGERVWDQMRLIDWAESLPEIDTSTVLMMGNSGGGVATLYSSACDKRVTVAVASCSFAPFVSRQGFLHHCDCNAVPGIFTIGDFGDIAGLTAPRKLLTVNGREDSLFAVPEVQRTVDRAAHIFAVAGAPENYEHRWGDEGHRFYADLMWPFVMGT